ncbi:PREDICTED: uncharacterized protein LOC107091287 [Cyprinodon variegatus]|uniref:Ciliary neurotrophic factor n=1 Tax=Cyprinodon variegatus TaxID=28743 RepID=A0A3Q2EJ84_CYPVA|nr:PREDICTED: uncharacterized protein LOC107091287 [Cyprinodon variegatus]
MNGHVKNMHFQQHVERAATLLCFLLLLAVDTTKTVEAGKNQGCDSDLQKTQKLTRLIHKQTGDLIKAYKASEGEMAQLFCKASRSDIPDPNISGLEPSERMASIYTQLQAFSPHLKRVQEQQMDLQPPKSLLLDLIQKVRDYSVRLTSSINNFYHNFFPNLPLPDPAGGPTTLPLPQNIFQQKIYGCVVLTTYKKLLNNISKDMRTLKIKVCTRAR